METRVQLVFFGEVLEGFEADTVRAKLGDIFKLEGDRLAEVFSGKRVVINRSVADADAPLHVARFAKLGARMHIEPAAAPAQAPAVGAPVVNAAAVVAVAQPAAASAAEEEQIVCPNCGERQSKRILCRACATDMPMGIAAKVEADREARAAQLAERRAARGLSPSGEPLGASGDAPPMWGLGFSGRMGRLPFAALSALLLAALVLLAAFMFMRPSGLRLAVFTLGVLAIVVLSVRAGVLRCHDCNRSGWWSLLLVVPYVDVVVSLLLSFLPGTAGDNDYGEPARPGSLPLTLLSLAALVGSLVLGGAVLASAFFGGDAAQAAGFEPAAATAPASTTAEAATAAPAGAQALSAQARAAFTNEYTPAPGHKAFAVSAGGAWGWKSGAASTDDAMEAAVATCEASRKPGAPDCEPVNVDGEWGSMQAE